MRQELCDGLAGVHWAGQAGSAGDAGEEEEEAAGGDGARPPLRRSVTSREQGNDGATRPRLTTDAGDSDMDSSCHCGELLPKQMTKRIRSTQQFSLTLGNFPLCLLSENLRSPPKSSSFHAHISFKAKDLVWD